MRTLLLFCLFAGPVLAADDEPSIQGKTLSEWRKALGDSDEKIRVQAVNALRQLGLKAAPAAPELVKVLRDTNATVSTNADFLLRSYGEKSLPAILEGLKDKGAPRQRLGTILYNISFQVTPAVGRPAIPQLAGLLEDTDRTLGAAAMNILARSGPEGADALIKGMSSKNRMVRQQIVYAAHNANPKPPREKLEALLAVALKDADGAVRSQAIPLLSQLGNDAIPLLIKALDDPLPYNRSLALGGLANFRVAAKEVRPQVLARLEDTDGTVRRSAAFTLAQIGLDAATAQKLVKHTDPFVRQALLQQISTLGDDRVPLLKIALADPFEQNRVLAIQALGSLGEKAKELSDELTKALADPAPPVRTAAALAVAKLDPKNRQGLPVLLEILEDGDAQVQQQIQASLQQDSANLIAPLGEMLAGKDPVARRRAARALGQIGFAARSTVPVLSGALGDEKVEVRLNAARALTRMGEPGMEAVLEALKGKDEKKRAAASLGLRELTIALGGTPATFQKLLEDQSSLVRVHAAVVLSRTGYLAANALPTLLKGAESEDVQERRSAVAGLGTTAVGPRFLTLPVPSREDVYKALAKALEDKDTGVRLQAVLAYTNPVRVSGPALTAPDRVDLVRILAHGLKGDPEDREPALLALGQLRDRARPAVKEIAALLSDDDPRLKRIAAHALGEIGSAAAEAVPALIKGLRDPSQPVRQLSAQALASIGPEAKEATDALVKAIEEQDTTLRLSALQALERIGPGAKSAVPALVKLLKGPLPTGPARPLFPPFGRPGLQPQLPGPRPIETPATTLILRALMKIGPDAEAAVPVLAGLLEKDEDRLQAALTLGKLGEAGVASLLKGLRSTNQGQREACVRGLSEVEKPSEEVLKGLITALEDEKTPVRLQALFALGQLGTGAREALPALKKLAQAQEQDENLRRVAALTIDEVEGKKKDRPEAAGEVPEKYRKPVDKGLSWLVKQQHADGHWAAANDQYGCSMTALAGMALLSEGSTPSKGKYAVNLRKAVDWLVERSQVGGANDGLITTPNDPRYIFGHGHAMQFLALVLDDLDPQRRKRVREVLNRAAQFAGRARTKLGGWGYVSATEGSNFDEGACTLTQLLGLHATANAGIPVSPEAIKDGWTYLSKSTTQRGGLVYSLATGGGGAGSERPPLTTHAIVVALVGKSPDEALLKKWLAFSRTMQPVPGGRLISGLQDYGLFYWAQAIWALGDEGWEKLFPDSKQAERVTWSQYRQLYFDQLERTQGPDGSWAESSVGPVYATSMNLIVLQLDRGRLLSRRK